METPSPRPSTPHELRKVTSIPWASVPLSVNQGEQWDDPEGPLCSEDVSSSFFCLFPPLTRRGTQLHLPGRWFSFRNWWFALCLPLSDVTSRPRARGHWQHSRLRSNCGLTSKWSTIINSVLCKAVPEWIILTSCLNGRRSDLQKEANPLQLSLRALSP